MLRDVGRVWQGVDEAYYELWIGIQVHALVCAGFLPLSQEIWGRGVTAPGCRAGENRLQPFPLQGCSATEPIVIRKSLLHEL